VAGRAHAIFCASDPVVSPASSGPREVGRERARYGVPAAVRSAGRVFPDARATRGFLVPCPRACVPHLVTVGASLETGSNLYMAESSLLHGETPRREKKIEARPSLGSKRTLEPGLLSHPFVTRPSVLLHGRGRCVSSRSLLLALVGPDYHLVFDRTFSWENFESQFYVVLWLYMANVFFSLNLKKSRHIACRQESNFESTFDLIRDKGVTSCSAVALDY
jgi:hypothetical protein